MFNKELSNGKYRYYQKYYDSRVGKWLQKSVTMKSKSRVSEAEARRRLALKIEKALLEPTADECKEQEKRSKTLEEVFLEWSIIRKKAIKSSSYKSEQNSLRLFLETFRTEKIVDLTTAIIQEFFDVFINWGENFKK